MARLPSLLDLVNAKEPDGSIGVVAELLNETNEILADIGWMEGNLPTGNRTVIRTGLPAGTWRRLYQGVQPDKSTRMQVTDTCGMHAAYNEVDCDLVDLEGNAQQFRMDEATATIEGMSQELAKTLFYGNTSIDPEKFDGFAPRYNSLAALNSKNIIDAGGVGTDNRSIWLIVWGSQSCFGLYPKGTTGGITVQDKGKTTINNADGSRMEAYQMYFQLKAGLCVKDWRYAVRIANIDFSDLRSDASTGANLPSLMFKALEIIPNLSIGTPVFYMAREVRTFFREQLANLTKTSTLDYSNVGGHRTALWNDIPLRRVDKLNVDEARVV